MGFFKQDDIPINTEIHAPTCIKCGLSTKCVTPKMPVQGEGKKGIYLVGEFPSKADDQAGTQFAGKSGKYLQRVLKKAGIAMRKDCYTDNAVCCRVPKGGANGTQIDACRASTWDNITERQPNVVVLMGTNALSCCIGHRWKKDLGAINKWQGLCIPDRDLNAWIVPTYHPSFILQNNKKNPVLNKIFANDIERAVQHTNVALPQYKDEQECVRVLHTEDAQIEYMRTLYNLSLEQDILLAFDYETTGIKPHAAGHAIACVSLAYHPDDAVAFMFPLGKKASRWFQRIMQAPRIHKTAHNMKFEQTWTLNILGYSVFPWAWCSMQGAHVIDNRPGITGLKFQTYINFGMMGYDYTITPYLRTEEKSANAINNVFSAPKSELLLYCGIDSVVQYRLALKQMQEVGYDAYIPKFT